MVSLDNDALDDDLSPSDPLVDDDNNDNEAMVVDMVDSDDNPFLTSDDTSFNHPVFPSSEDVLLVSVLHGHDYFPRCLQSSSLPTPIHAKTAMLPSDHDIMFTPNTERKHQ